MHEYLGTAATQVTKMWDDIEPSGIHRADANDTIHFLHEEACEVAKVAMRLGLIGSQEYVRSEEVMARVYTTEDLIMEVGDVLLMALTLARAFDLNASKCLGASIDKFYRRAGVRYLEDQHPSQEAATDNDMMAPSYWVLCRCDHMYAEHATGPCRADNCNCKEFVRAP